MTIGRVVYWSVMIASLLISAASAAYCVASVISNLAR